MAWEIDFLSSLALKRGGLAAPALLDKVERSFWLELSRAPVLDAAEEQRIELRRYGPVMALTVAALPRTPMFNPVLGAAEPGAVEEGHLEAALDWVESVGVESRVPVSPDRRDAGEAEDVLNRRGYSRTTPRVRFIRSTAPPDFPELPGIEVIEVTEFTEGFSEFPGVGFGLDMMSFGFFDCLPQRDQWRCYVALDEREAPIASASMLLHWEVASLGFAATATEARGKGAHLALLRRRIADARRASCHTICAEIDESPGDPAGPSTATRNLVRAGFKQQAIRPVWVPA